MTEPSEPAVAMHQTPAPEDQARANFYALLSRLYAAAPDADLLRTIADAGELLAADAEGPAAGLASAWRLLGKASAAMDPEAVADEYQNLFVGVGKSEVSLHASAYVSSAGTSALAEVRATLARLGLGRKSGVSLYEDHLAAVCETMRALIGGTGGPDAAAPHPLADQRDFFGMHVAPWVFACCNAIRVCPIANYYRRVAEFTEFFLAIERDSFAIE
jgi:TorA maturation chaperone TorD